jgi:hypothetical protein
MTTNVIDTVTRREAAPGARRQRFGKGRRIPLGVEHLQQRDCPSASPLANLLASAILTTGRDLDAYGVYLIGSPVNGINGTSFNVTQAVADSLNFLKKVVAAALGPSAPQPTFGSANEVEALAADISLLQFQISVNTTACDVKGVYF